MTETPGDLIIVTGVRCAPLVSIIRQMWHWRYFHCAAPMMKQNKGNDSADLNETLHNHTVTNTIIQ